LSGLEPLMSIEELSEYLNVPVRRLYDWRLAGKGPCAVHIGRQIGYFVTDVHEWLRQNREAEPGHLVVPASLGRVRSASVMRGVIVTVPASGPDWAPRIRSVCLQVDRDRAAGSVHSQLRRLSTSR
jgi:hypothetical protein